MEGNYRELHWNEEFVFAGKKSKKYRKIERSGESRELGYCKKREDWNCWSKKYLKAKRIKKIKVKIELASEGGRERKVCTKVKVEIKVKTKIEVEVEIEIEIKVEKKGRDGKT